MRAAWLVCVTLAIASFSSCNRPPRSADGSAAQLSAAAQTSQKLPDSSAAANADPAEPADASAEPDRAPAVAIVPAPVLGPVLAMRPVSPAIDPMLAVGTLAPAADDYAASRIGTAPYVLPAWSKHLKNVRIALDPGHGGDAHERGYKRGPTGVREAEVNLRLAQYLGEFLRAAGAEVLLTRADDREVSLADRAAMANRWPADLFISLHHNATSKKPGTNYSSVWHHGPVDRSPASLDLARYLADGLHDALGLDQVTDVPVKSDLLMYPGGFAVLRSAEMPAVLCECSFYSNPAEERRLRDPEYVLHEAHGLFLALARYAHAGLPRVRLVEPAGGVVSAASTLVFELDDGLRRRKAWGWQRRMLLSDSIVARVDGRRVEHQLSSDGADRVKIKLPEDLDEGPHVVELNFQNQQKNSALNPTCEFVVGPRPSDIAARPSVAAAPERPEATDRTYYLRRSLPAAERE